MIKVQIRTSLDKALDFLIDKIKTEIEGQGHNASGKLLNSIEKVIEETPNGFIGRIMINDYAIYLDKGVKPSRVPYTEGSGAKTSKYIDALVDWIKIIKPSLSEKERLGFAFGIARKAKKEGHPTRGSYKFSSNGRRKEWSKFAIDQNISSFEELLELGKAVAGAYESFNVSGIIN